MIMSLNDGEKFCWDLWDGFCKSHLSFRNDDIFDNISENRANLNRDLLEADVLWANKRWMLILDIPWWNKYPYLDQMIFRLIENAFETVGGATGLGIKTDKYNEKFHQLIVAKLWQDIDDLKLLSGYRYYQRPENKKDIDTPMSNMFNLEEKSLLLSPNLKVLELWTAWSCTASDKMESLLSFSGTWSGLVSLTEKYNNEDIFIWKMTIPASYDKMATVFAIKYLEMSASTDNCGMSVKAWVNEKTLLNSSELQKIEKDLSWLLWDYKQDAKQIKEILWQDYYWKVNDLPAMFPLYLSRFKQWKFYYVGTTLNANVLESGIVVPIKALDDSVRENYAKDFVSNEKNGLSLWKYLETRNK